MAGVSHSGYFIIPAFQSSCLYSSYSVGETRPSRGPGRREIGHGALAERALVPVIPSEEEFPYAIRLVSEVLSSNGSTSQGSICASTLSLMDAGVPIKAPVAGISVGLVTGDTDDIGIVDSIDDATHITVTFDTITSATAGYLMMPDQWLVGDESAGTYLLSYSLILKATGVFMHQIYLIKPS